MSSVEYNLGQVEKGESGEIEVGKVGEIEVGKVGEILFFEKRKRENFPTFPTFPTFPFFDLAYNRRFMEGYKVRNELEKKRN